MKIFNKLVIDINSSIHSALAMIEDNNQGFLIVINQVDVVVGTLTDGDIRRQLLSGMSFSDSIKVGSNFNVLKEIITENKNAIFVKNYKNARSWKNEITKLINKPEKMKIISKNNYKLSKKYSHSIRAIKILNIIK